MATMPINPQTAAQSDPGLFDKWRAWLGSEQNRSALLQTGLALMQPVQPGQSQFGHIASSIGQGLGAAGRTEARLKSEALAQQKLDRELSADALDREIKRSGLELDKLNTQSLIADRQAGQGIARSRLALDQAQEGRQSRLTDAQIANLQSQSDTREGSLALKQDAERAKQEATAAKQALEQEKLGLQREVLAARQAGDERRAQQAEARLKQTDTKIALSAKKLAEAENAAQTITLKSMFKTKDAIAKDVWTAANDPYATEPRSMDELLAARIKLQKDIDAGLGGDQRGQSSGGTVPPSPPAQTSSYPSPKSQAEYEALPSGTVFVAPNGSIRRKP